jgi:hypothetical protein
MNCDRAPDRALLLSQGLFGAPAPQAERELEIRAAERRMRAGADEGSRPT